MNAESTNSCIFFRLFISRIQLTINGCYRVSGSTCLSGTRVSIGIPNIDKNKIKGIIKEHCKPEWSLRPYY